MGGRASKQRKGKLKLEITNPKQIRTVDRMKKRGFITDYILLRNFNPAVHMSRVVNGLKRYAEVTVDGLVNGRVEMAFT